MSPEIAVSSRVREAIAIGAELVRVRDDVDQIERAVRSGDLNALVDLPNIAARLVRLSQGAPTLPDGLTYLGAAMAWRGKNLHLTRSELPVVAHLAINRGNVRSYAALNLARHGRPFATGKSDPDGRVALRGNMTRIRRRFLAVDPAFDRIEAVPGFGYRWKDDTA